jgi:hypothetical protein
VPEISHVRIAVPDQGPLNRILREGGAQLFPQWLYSEPGSEPRILWWGVRGALAAPDSDEADAGVSAGLFPRQVDDWTEAPRGLILASVDAQRAAQALIPILGEGWQSAGRDDVLGADCWRLVLGRSVLVLAEPLTEGYVAACLARFGEGPVAVGLDGAPATGHPAVRNPLNDGMATYVRLGPKTAPTLIFLPPR